MVRMSDITKTNLITPWNLEKLQNIINYKYQHLTFKASMILCKQLYYGVAVVGQNDIR